MHNLRQDVTLVRYARARPVQIDDVDPAGARSNVTGGQCRGVPVAVLPGEVTLRQPHRGAGAQVDGRQELHHATALAASTKFASSANPVAPDFSGWNWAPHTAPRVANAATSPP